MRRKAAKMKTVSSRQIAEAFGRRHADVLRMIRNIPFKYNLFIKSSYKDNSGKENNQYFISLDGCKALIDATRLCTKGRVEFIDFVNEQFGEEIDTVFLTQRHEERFVEKLKESLKAMGYTMEQQYNIGGFRIDAYIPRLNIAVEYDEEQHFVGRAKAEDKKRQKYIESKLGCTFVRCHFKDSDAFNIGKVFAEIINKSNQFSVV